MTGVERMNRYIDWVLNPNNEPCTNQWIKKAVKRHLRDLERVQDPEYAYRFDTEKANKIVAFAELLKQSKDEWAGQPIVLQDWQCFVFCSIYGWVFKETGLRRFRKAFIYVARKNGKSLMCAVPGLYDLLSTPGAEVCCAANKREQAKRVWDDALHMVEQNESLSSRIKVYNSTSKLINYKKAAVMEALSADNQNFDGKNPSLIIADELAAMPNYDTIKILQSGQGSRPEPLILEITSGSDHLESPGKQEFDRSCKILDQVFDDDSYFCVLYCIEDTDKWDDPSVWQKANPMLGYTVKEKTIQDLCTEAKQNPRLRGEFITKQCARWSRPLKAWIQPDVWRRVESNTARLDLNKPFVAVGALDLSKKTDLTAYSICFYQNKQFFYEHRFYFPIGQMQVKIKTDNELWDYWVDQGYVIPTPGDTVSYDQMYADVLETWEKYHIKEVLFDPNNAQNSLVPALQDKIDLVECGTTKRVMSPMLKHYEESIYKGEVSDQNPVLKWMISNAEVKVDENEQIQICKPDQNAASSKRIDGVVTSAMSLGRLKDLINAKEIDDRSSEEKRLARQAFLARMREKNKGVN